MTPALPASRQGHDGRPRVDHRALLRFAAPLMATNAIQAVLNLTDTWFIGRLSTDALAGMGAIYWIMTCVILVLGGVSFAVQTFVAQALGSRRRARASQAEESANGRRPSVVIEDYLRLLRELEANYPRSPAQTPLEFAEFVVGAESTLADLLPLTELYYAARFRENIWAKEETERVNALLRLLRESSKRES